MVAHTGSGPTHGHLRDYLIQQDPDMATAANYTWGIACDIHDRQTDKSSNINGRKHVEQVERNIWKLLSETYCPPPGSPLNLERFSPMDIYILSCAACCHDFDKGLHNEVLGSDFRHGEGSGKFVYDNWQNLGIVSQAAAEYIDSIVSIHDYKEDFDERLQGLPDITGLPPLRCLATLLKAADTLHMDESRISRLAVPDDSLTGFDRLKQLARGNIHGWGLDGRRIVITVSIKDEETGRALLACERFLKQTEWPPIARNLREHQFPDIIEFKWICPYHIRRELVKQGLMMTDGIIVNIDFPISPPMELTREAGDGLFLDEPFRIVAIQPQDLGTYLCEMGPLSVIDNEYIAPDLHDLGAKPGAVSRVFVGPANCGKTRAAYEWIREKIGPNTNDWVILRPESGSIPQDAAKFEIDWKSRFGDRRRRPYRAILFVDDLPDFLPPPSSGPGIAEAVHRLFAWFRDVLRFQERCFVGTIRTERMIDKPGWPERLLELGEDLRLLRIESLDEPRRRKLWQGMGTARTDVPTGVQALDMNLSSDFIDAVTPCDSDPETISYFTREMALCGKKQLTEADVKRFTVGVVGIWLRETWPAIQKAYGAAASVFFTIGRLIEAGAQPASRFKGSLTPLWEYHDVYGPALLAEYNEKPEDYIPAIKQMLRSGHASGIVGEWIRPKFDFILQAPAIDEVVVRLPSPEWFAINAHALTADSQLMLSFHFSCAGSPFTRDGVTPYWLLGHAMALDFLANRDQAEAPLFYEEELHTLEELQMRFGVDESPVVREPIARGLANKGLVLGNLGRDIEAVAAYEELVLCFGEDEAPAVREHVARGLANKGTVLSRLERYVDAVAAYGELVHRFGDDETPTVRERVARGLFNKGVVLGRLGRDEDAVAAYEELTQRFGDDETPAVREHVARGLLSKGVDLGSLERYDDALAAYKELQLRFGDEKTPAVREYVVRGLLSKGLVLGSLLRYEDAVTAFTELQMRFGDDETPAIQEQVATGLLSKGVLLTIMIRHDEAVAAFEELQMRFGDEEAPAVRLQVARGLVSNSWVLSFLERYDDALVACKELQLCFGDDETPAVQEQIAKGLLSKGEVLDSLERCEDAVAAYEELLQRFGDDEAPAVAEQVAKGLVNKGDVLDSLERYEDAVAAYEELLQRFGDDEAPAVAEQVAMGLVNKGDVLDSLERYEDAVAAYEELLQRFGDDEAPAVAEQVAMGLVNKGLVLGSLERYDDAVAVFDEVTQRFGEEGTHVVQEQVAIGLVSKGLVLNILERYEDALHAYEELQLRFGDDETPIAQWYVTKGLVNKGLVLDRLERYDDALAVYEELQLRFGDDETPAVREQVARGLSLRGLILVRLERYDDALAAYEELQLRFGDDETPAVREQVAKGLVRKGEVLIRLERYDDALAVYEELQLRFGDDETPAVREQVALGLVRKGEVLDRLERYDDALAVYEELQLRFGDDETPAVREQVAKGLVRKGEVLDRLERYDDALAAYEELQLRFGDDETPAVREQVARGLSLRGVVLFRLERYDDALATYEVVTQRFGENESPVVRQYASLGLLSKGLLLSSLERYQDAVAAYEELAQRFGEDESNAVRDPVAKGFYNNCDVLIKCWHKTRTRSYIDQAIVAARASVAMGGKVYKPACVLALAGILDEAFQLLEKSLFDGEIKWTDVIEDSDWADFRNDPRYSELEVKFSEPN